MWVGLRVVVVGDGWMCCHGEEEVEKETRLVVQL
jgi:hypothetical protein